YTSSDGQAELPANNIQTAQWTRSLTIDKVTGEELGSSYWTSNKGQFETVITPEVEGYSADKDKVEGKTVGQRNLEETVVYIPLTGDINGKPKENKADDILVEEIQDLEVLDQVEEQVEAHDGPVTYGPGDDFEAPVSSQAEGKGSKHKMPINLK
ncbi:MAG: mucin-binding protein, partial [Streptococcus salivarius]